MSCLFWNCQGLGVPLTIHTIGGLLRKHDPDLVFVSETLATSVLIERLKRKWNFHGISVDKVGRSGGLALLWKKDITVDLLSFSRNHIDVSVECRFSGRRWRLTGFYGIADHRYRNQSWALIRHLYNQSTLPWLVGGDFNEVLTNDEKEGGNVRMPGLIDDFRQTLVDCNLLDLGFVGSLYTWSNNRASPETVRCRLDRCCSTNNWRDIYPTAQVQHLDPIGSDHHPILLTLRPDHSNHIGVGKRPFRFEALWINREECETIIQGLWEAEANPNPAEAFLSRVHGCRVALVHWNRTSVRERKNRIELLRNKLRDCIMGPQTAEVITKIHTVRTELEKSYEEEDMYWKQRSRVQWMQEGDRNTSFFHAKATARKKTNTVARLKDNLGNWKEGPEIKSVISNYFDSIFQTTFPSANEIDEVADHIERRISEAGRQSLDLPFTPAEFGALVPTRGLRQGDPLSPYLFILCTEALTTMLHKAVHEGRLHGVKIAQSAPTISHLCFADDTLLFCEATTEDATTVRDILTCYARASGQEINLEKSMMKFCPSTTAERKTQLHDILGFPIVDHHDRYLGLPTTLGRARTTVFSFLKDRIWNKIKGWGERQLSRAGKEVLIKSVLQAVPSYVMSCFQLPNGLLRDLESAIRRYWWSSGKHRYVPWLSWSRLCRSKETGGMGFRELASFNLALLAKQVWRLLTQPDTLFSTLFRAKYFPHGNILTADLGLRPSVTWRSIRAAIPYVEKGIRIRVGNGLNTAIWGDRWLTDDGNRRILTRRSMTSVFPDKVADLIDRDTGTWNMELLTHVFWPIDCDRILACPLGGPQTQDRIVWHHSLKCNFTVKSCYHLILSSCTQQHNSGDQGPVGGSGTSGHKWTKIWQLPIPPKMKVFIWRACSESLPTGVELFRRKITQSPFCFGCKEKIETTIHALKECNLVKDIWLSAPFNCPVGEAFGSVWAWFEALQSILSPEKFIQAMVVIWKIWDNRNCLLHGEKVTPAHDITNWSTTYLDAFTQARKSYPMDKHQPHPTTWSRPPTGVIKINFDAGFPAGEQFYGISMVARDDSGTCLGWLVHRIEGRPAIVVGEALAALQAMRMAASKGWNAVSFEGDNLGVMTALQDKDILSSLIGAIIEECLSLVRSFEICSFHFVKRSGNELTHALVSTLCHSGGDGSVLPSSLAILA